MNSDFEIGGCASRVPGNASLSDEMSTVYAGKLACRVCMDTNPGTSVYSISQRVEVSALEANAVYRASAQVRLPASGKPATELHVALVVDGGNDYTSDDNVLGGEVPDATKLSTAYHLSQSQGLKYVPSDKTKSMYVEYINRVGDNGCFIIDDAVITRQP